VPTAAFVRAEGALLDRPALQAAAWMAANAQELGSRFVRLGGIALAAPFSLAGDRSVGTRLAWSALRGSSQDRLEVLGEEYWDVWLKPRIRRIGQDLVERARASGHRVVVVSDHPEPIARHLAAHLRADHLVANRLELRNGRATGRLLEPLASRFGGPALRAFADAHGIDLAGSLAYGAVEGDAVLLASVGLPCAVHPDRVLRRMSRDLDWPVVEA
jgi:phosphoserine phosphatase